MLNKEIPGVVHAIEDTAGLQEPMEAVSDSLNHLGEAVSSLPHDSVQAELTAMRTDLRDISRAIGTAGKVEISDPLVLIAMATVLVAIAAVGVALWEGMTNRHFAGLSVLPSIRVTRQANVDHEMGYSFINAGFGSAKILSVQLKMTDSDPLPMDTEEQVEDAVEALGFTDSEYDSHFGLTGELIAVGQSVEVLSFPYDVKNKAAQKRICEVMSKTEMIVTYESVLKKTYVSSG